MIITINADWRLASDPLQWSLQKRKLVKGEEQWRSLAFFRDLDKGASSPCCFTSRFPNQGVSLQRPNPICNFLYGRRRCA